MPESARKIKGRLNLILKWAIGHGYVQINVAEEINGALSKQPKTAAHMRSVPYKGIPAVLSAIRHAPTTEAARLCVEFILLTAVRSQEARLAEWSEIDWDTKTWTIPALRMKMQKNPPGAVVGDGAGRSDESQGARQCPVGLSLAAQG